MLDLMQGS